MPLMLCFVITRCCTIAQALVVFYDRVSGGGIPAKYTRARCLAIWLDLPWHCEQSNGEFVNVSSLSRVQIKINAMSTSHQWQERQRIS
ncbi:uncharacterized protein F5Z01DRAFT_657943 [Emericellopsis atlantica]|uniref:Secreted protein n=1 Tax=Emericellopsis atlantica TaxID=2614577 RepID=A0A9P7ZLG4_9HYPO|nr:uncharacterized protein F5Z01DRAFT_657943 [Emericellopsis atlantica]KAG9253668.1 hypothetical protein F5Z01DRAFT_657943 [Emericellopsis atlantica]